MRRPLQLLALHEAPTPWRQAAGAGMFLCGAWLSNANVRHRQVGHVDEAV